MRFLKSLFRGISFESAPLPAPGALAPRALLIGMPLICLILIPVFFIVGKNVQEVLNRANARNANLQAQAMSASLEHVLRETRNQLLILGAGSLMEREMLRKLRASAKGDGPNYREIAFAGPDERYLLLNHGGQIISVPPKIVRDMAANPFQSLEERQARGRVSISRPLEVNYPPLSMPEGMRGAALHVLRFSTPIYSDEGEFRGVLTLSLDLAALRDRLAPSVLDEGEKRRGASFFFDQDGWMMFQSETGAEKERPIGSDIARAGFRGDIGRPGFSAAFRPAPEHLNYWTMVSEIQSGHAGLMTAPASAGPGGDQPAPDWASYAPVSFQESGGAEPRIIGGVAMLDDGFAAAAGNRFWGIYLCAFLVCLLLLSFGLWQFARIMSRKISLLAERIERRGDDGEADAPSLPRMPLELDRLARGLDGLLARLREAMDMEKSSSEARAREWRRQPVKNLPALASKHCCHFVGESEPMRRLYEKIEKAAAVDADVLVVGETGAGKELVASAIHQLSARRQAPFMSINCGALDESLLMDTLFGHVRGAFTEARGERKGAFLAASGGVLLLDEIGNAPPRVQQALLRALSTRRIRPLGADQEIGFDTRIIAATNAPLRDGLGNFRDDLYYRLAVLTIEAPPIRDRKSDIPCLVKHFMSLAAAGGKGGCPGLSQGALAKLTAHDWPGNVRELRNVITRAMAFCDGKIILAEDLQLGDISMPEGGEEQGVPESGGEASGKVFEQLNERQRSLWPAVALLGVISRQEYQNLAGGGISSRTAQYDLKAMARLGLLKKEGRGPSQRYVAAQLQGEGGSAA